MHSHWKSENERGVTFISTISAEGLVFWYFAERILKKSPAGRRFPHSLIHKMILQNMTARENMECKTTAWKEVKGSQSRNRTDEDETEVEPTSADLLGLQRDSHLRALYLTCRP